MKGTLVIFIISICITGYSQNLIGPPDNTKDIEVLPEEPVELSAPLQQQDSASVTQFSPFIPDKPFPISFNPEDIGQTQVQEDPKINNEEFFREAIGLSDPLLQEDANNPQFSPITPDESIPISFNPEDFGQTQIQEDPNLQITIENEDRKINQIFDQPESSQFKFPSPSLIIRDPGLNSIGMPKDGKDHPCYRVCRPWDRRTCYYKFHVEWYHAMSKACMDCPRNPAHCGNPDCVPANGVERTITVVNRKMPGPAIEVCVGDKIVVDVVNSLHASGTTIHWHGMHQKATPYMDGAPYVTQCPIQPESTFRYEFDVPTPGSYFWHSHIGLQRGDGTTGSLIIRQPRSSTIHGRLYDVDRSEHVMVVTDWINNAAIDLYTNHHHSTDRNQPNRPGSILINGRGRFEVPDGVNTITMKAPVFEVEKGLRYRFRLINGNFLNCPVELSVDGHNITVIASDGFDLAPITASKLVTYAGERYDFIINAWRPVDAYWIRIRGLLPCAPAGIRQVAVLRYKGAKAEEPSILDWNATRDGLILNQVQEGEEQNVTIPVSRMRALVADDPTLKPMPDHKFYIGYDMWLKNNTDFHRVPYYGTDKVERQYWVYTPQLNHISMQLPKSPLLVSRPSGAGFCNEFTIPPSCTKEFCQCPHVLNVKLNSVVEVVLIDEGTLDVNHPFHLHGHSFRVIGQRRLGTSTTVEEVKALDRAGKIRRNLRRPPVKDTVTIPDGGYTIIRFLADNPGYWLFHCHIEFHAEIGMALVFKVGEHRDMRPVPKGFPQCGDFKQTDYKFV